MNKDKDFLGTEPVGKLMFRLALPTITAQLINMLYNIIDRIYIGHIPGNGALALTGVGVFPLLPHWLEAVVHRMLRLQWEKMILILQNIFWVTAFSCRF